MPTKNTSRTWCQAYKSMFTIINIYLLTRVYIQSTQKLNKQLNISIKIFKIVRWHQPFAYLKSLRRFNILYFNIILQQSIPQQPKLDSQATSAFLSHFNIIILLILYKFSVHYDDLPWIRFFFVYI